MPAPCHGYWVNRLPEETVTNPALGNRSGSLQSMPCVRPGVAFEHEDFKVECLSRERGAIPRFTLSIGQDLKLGYGMEHRVASR